MQKLNLILTCAVVFALCVPVHAQSQLLEGVDEEKPTLKSDAEEQLALAAYLKAISNPDLDYEAKLIATDGVSELAPERQNEFARAEFIQANPELAAEALNALIHGLDQSLGTNYRHSNLKFIQENFSKVKPKVRIAVLSTLIESVGLQDREDEDLYHQVARYAVENYSKGELPSREEDVVISQGCLLLSLSPLFDDTDRKLMIDAAPATQSSRTLALALSYSKVLNASILDQLRAKSNSFQDEVVFKLVASQSDEKDKSELIESIKLIADRIYPNTVDGNGRAKEDDNYIHLMRFLHFPEKKNLVIAASKSTNAAIKEAALLLAADEYPEYVLKYDSLKSTFENEIGSLEEYNFLLTFLALRHPSYSEDVRKILSAENYESSVEKLRSSGTSVFINSFGFNGI